MDISPHSWELIGRYLGAGLALGLGGIGSGIGMGMAAGTANTGIMRQPARQGYLLRTMLIGQAVGGSPSIFALVIGLLILFVPAGGAGEIGGNFVAAAIGAGLAIGLGCFGSGVGCGWPSAAACEGVARNPRRVSLNTQGMIVGQAVAQSPSIFATVVALLLVFGQAAGTDWPTMGIFIAAGFAIGASGLGSGWGSGITAGGAVEGMGSWPEARGITMRTMLIGQSVCQTPAIFGLLVSFILLFTLGDISADFVNFARIFGAGVSVGFGGIGPGIGGGIAGSSACLSTACNPRHGTLILRTMLTGQAVSQSTAIYSLIIALALLYVV